MKVEFVKTGERRYAVKIRREDFSDLEMNPAPGFDELMPHDLCHLIVEQALKIENGIYGQIAQGGTAGSFRAVNSSSKSGKEISRKHRKFREKGKDLAKNNLEDLAKSERATFVCLQNWLSHSDNEILRQKAFEMKESSDSILGQMSIAERTLYTQQKFTEVRAKMDEISRQWKNLKTGESVIINWAI